MSTETDPSLCPSTQCAAMCPVSFYYKGGYSYPACILDKFHDGPHKAALAYEGMEWEDKR